MNKSTIDWTEYSWNPITGCTKISPGCKNCYAEKVTKWLKGMGQEKYKTGFHLTCHPTLLKEPLKIKKGREIFVCSMSDILHKDVPDPFIKSIFQTMQLAAQHRFYVLTKRSDRLYSMRDELDWQKNIWMGVTVESENYLYRIDHLRGTGAAVKFLSIEPLLGPLPNIDLTGIDWVIVGGESGREARFMKKEWVIDIRDQCIDVGIPFFFKQWSHVNGKKTGCLLEGKIWNQKPDFNGQSEKRLINV
ncbi:MAG: phage Gp37/Gp68 family protein [Proteobacteria bacterium]|nr:phage Gp37/Gp68 family protein [Desulfobacula sp.]MBU3951504.1 phage Gp37/Gp68 family protein [Pseudomonadota bacterium]